MKCTLQTIILSLCFTFITNSEAFEIQTITHFKNPYLSVKIQLQLHSEKSLVDFANLAYHVPLNNLLHPLIKITGIEKLPLKADPLKPPGEFELKTIARKEFGPFWYNAVVSFICTDEITANVYRQKCQYSTTKSSSVIPIVLQTTQVICERSRPPLPNNLILCKLEALAQFKPVNLPFYSRSVQELSITALFEALTTWIAYSLFFENNFRSADNSFINMLQNNSAFKVVEDFHNLYYPKEKNEGWNPGEWIFKFTNQKWDEL